jgi:hypothetical protein
MPRHHRASMIVAHFPPPRRPSTYTHIHTHIHTLVLFARGSLRPRMPQPVPAISKPAHARAFGTSMHAPAAAPGEAHASTRRQSHSRWCDASHRSARLDSTLDAYVLSLSQPLSRLVPTLRVPHGAVRTRAGQHDMLGCIRRVHSVRLRRPPSRHHPGFQRRDDCAPRERPQVRLACFLARSAGPSPARGQPKHLWRPLPAISFPQSSGLVCCRRHRIRVQH